MLTVIHKNGVETRSYVYGSEKYEYDITKMRKGFSVQVSSGDEEYTDYYGGIDLIIMRDIANILWSGYPTRSQKLWNNSDITNYIEFINSSEARRELFKETISDMSNYRDASAILYALKDGSAEAFDRYDSDVAEQFIRACEIIENYM